ncbi:MAG: sugar ABC transporter permease [Chloroflexi bacterium]|nr:sugar ABC transporter permease [Chloroflexota bacterium]MCL5108367.1 sugar ABC transporter permease [Chloroflexota bacterium]
MSRSGPPHAAASLPAVRPRAGFLQRVQQQLDRESTLGPLLMLPGALLLVVFLAYPFFLGIWLSMTDTTLGRPGNFVGLQNFANLMTDSIFQQTARNTFIYSTVTVPFKLLLGLALAVVLNNQMPFRNFIRAGVLMPWIVPTALSSLGWFMIFDPVFSPFSWLLKSWGLITKNINFLGDPNLAITSIMVANIWRGTPFFAVAILAALQTVPAELLEAAAIDGAGAWQRFRNVTLPAIMGIVLITTLLSIIWTFADFQLVYVLTKGGPANMTHIFGTYAYNVGLWATAIGQGAAIALTMFPILAILAILLLRYLRTEV